MSKPWLPMATGPCDLRHRSMDAFLDCPGYHPDYEPKPDGDPPGLIHKHDQSLCISTASPDGHACTCRCPGCGKGHRTHY